MSRSVPDQAEFALQAESLVANLGGVPVLNGLSFGFRPGRWISVVGPNGAGKTTLFNVISGMQDPTAGIVSVNGVDISHESPHRRAKRGLARTFQRLELFASLTVRKNGGLKLALVGGTVSASMTAPFIRETNLVRFGKSI